MKPFLSFYGAKWRIAPKYPAPLHDTIIEPFAGSAGYAVRNHTKNVILVERDPRIASVWKYLISASTDDINALPLLDRGCRVGKLDVCEGAKNLIGFWLSKGSSHPVQTPSAWAREDRYSKQFWGPEIRSRIAEQVPHIKHWKLLEGDYTLAPDVEATWFIDPPYFVAGKYYTYADIDYAALAKWSTDRKGQTMVCEGRGATWLPFKTFGTFKATEGKNRTGKTMEVIWTNETPISKS